MTHIFPPRKVVVDRFRELPPRYWGDGVAYRTHGSGGHWRVDTGQVGAGSKKIILRTKSCSYIHWVTMPGAGPGATEDMDHGYAWYDRMCL